MRLSVPILISALGLVLITFAILPTLVFSLESFVNPQKPMLDPSAVSLSLKSLTNASDWFKNSPSNPPPTLTTQTHFTLSFPAVGISDIPVTVNGQDLKKGAIHYPGTTLPGEYGNTVIFGHSALPIFFKKNSPLTVFNPILKAKAGDEIDLNFDGIHYRYRVRKMTEVSPSQIEVLFQDYSRKELTLITCTPLGTYWRRFIVRAELVN